MQDVTIYRHEDGKARVTVWKDRDNPTPLELTPKWATIMSYTTMPHDWVRWIKDKTEDEVNEILSRYVP